MVSKHINSTYLYETKVYPLAKKSIVRELDININQYHRTSKSITKILHIGHTIT